MLLNADFSSLCTLSLGGVITHLPWKNLSELTTFELWRVPGDKISVTQLLDFFVNAPFLDNIELHSIPNLSDAPPGRVVSIPHLENLTISTDLAHSILLDHLSIPTRANLFLNFKFSGEKFPPPDFLPKAAKNLENLSHVTTVNLYFHEGQKYMRLDGPSGGISICGNWEDWVEAASLDLDRRILRSLDYFALSRTERLAITGYEPLTLTEIDKSSPYHILDGMKNLRTLVLTRCNNLPFILALDPNQSPSKPVLCPMLKELNLYVDERDSFNITELRSMVKERALKDAQLSSIVIVGLGELVPGREVFKLRKYVPHVEYRVEDIAPEWYSIPGDEYACSFVSLP